MKLLTATKVFTFAFGLFLGLAIWKFGNPVIFEHKIFTPENSKEWLNQPWPPHWANWILLPFTLLGAGLIILVNRHRLAGRWLWLLPLAWLGWQFLSATETDDADLTSATIKQFTGVVICYFLGALLFTRAQLWRWLLPGLLAALTFCLVRGIDQHVFEYPREKQWLIEGEQCGWTNLAPENVAELKVDHVIIRSTNSDADIVNPGVLEKYKKGRVCGTLVYPNALSELILLLWPVALALAFGATKKLKAPIRLAAITLTLFLGGAAFFWTGSKLGWLISLALAGLFLLRRGWPAKLKLAAVATILVLGLGVFALRFHHYFATGAPSAGARYDYWRAAAQTTVDNPLLGSGPGTFQRPYERLKAPESEMARLTHNDYLEQFSDSGVVGGLTYVAWVWLALVVAWKKLWRHGDEISFAVFAGLLGWCVQEIGEFGLYIPALAWTAFTLLGSLTGPAEKPDGVSNPPPL